MRRDHPPVLKPANRRPSDPSVACSPPAGEDVVLWRPDGGPTGPAGPKPRSTRPSVLRARRRARPTEGEEPRMTTADVHGPIDFVLIEFTADRLTGRAAGALLDLVDKRIITLYDILVVGKDDDGSVYAVDLAADAEQVGGFTDLAWVRSGLLT